jgi:hypothetical protein
MLLSILYLSEIKFGPQFVHINLDNKITFLQIIFYLDGFGEIFYHVSRLLPIEAFHIA